MVREIFILINMHFHFAPSLMKDMKANKHKAWR